ncbi:hypothetical protein SISSUDRAFT_1067952 [Sistotremastrum suecicum HHB10207 ss-3]|uniref:Uncharacterized protein n=1 Tax=Sistotremastrum suecicum HHB10207 ss-3 TaxID=1314776 RepID=A0A165WJA3_9AGAM|nr:hypothetical protein SISSUDRAFT_1067952 [Sistotremastrum suecicum HHB10207 ss-3]
MKVPPTSNQLISVSLSHPRDPSVMAETEGDDLPPLTLCYDEEDADNLSCGGDYEGKKTRGRCIKCKKGSKLQRGTPEFERLMAMPQCECCGFVHSGMVGTICGSCKKRLGAHHPVTIGTQPSQLSGSQLPGLEPSSTPAPSATPISTNINEDPLLARRRELINKNTGRTAPAANPAVQALNATQAPTPSSLTHGSQRETMRVCILAMVGKTEGPGLSRSNRKEELSTPMHVIVSMYLKTVNVHWEREYQSALLLSETSLRIWGNLEPEPGWESQTLGEFIAAHKRGAMAEHFSTRAPKWPSVSVPRSSCRDRWQPAVATGP